MSESINDNSEQEKEGIKSPSFFLPSPITLLELRPLLLNPQLSEHEHVKNIHEIGRKFTKNREEITDYVLNEDLVSSYAYFYLPTNVPKFYFVMDLIPKKVRDDILNSHFIDVGSGPGTYAYAFLTMADQVKEVTCIDSSPLMLKASQKILTTKFGQNASKIFFQKKLIEKENSATLFFGNSINEMGIEKALDLIHIVSPDHVMFIEPGTKDLFLELKKMRDILSSDYEIIYPCLGNFSCPYDWCHQVLRTGHSPCVERLSQLVQLDRKTMPLCAHVYRHKRLKSIKKDEKRLNVEEVRVIRYLNETKFSFLYEVCSAIEFKNEVYTIEILKKKMDKITERKFKNLSIGEKIFFVKEKKIGESWRGYAES